VRFRIQHRNKGVVRVINRGPPLKLGLLNCVVNLRSLLVVPFRCDRYLLLIQLRVIACPLLLLVQIDLLVDIL